MDKGKKECTFRDGKEGDGCNCILISMSDSIVGVANGQIEWVVLYMPSWHRDCGLITPKDNGAVHRSFGSWVRCKDLILCSSMKTHPQYQRDWNAYRMLPGNISWYDIVLSMLSMSVKVDIGAQIKLSIKVWIWQHRRYNSFRIVIPDLVVCLHLARRVFINVVWDPSYKTLPGDVT